MQPGKAALRKMWATEEFVQAVTPARCSTANPCPLPALLSLLLSPTLVSPLLELLSRCLPLFPPSALAADPLISVVFFFFPSLCGWVWS